MKKLIMPLLLTAVLALCTACSRSIAGEKIIGSWTCTPENGEAIHVTITDRTFTQSSGGATGAELKYERTSDGLNVRNTDGKVLIKLTYNDADGTISYSVNGADGTEQTYVFSRDAQ